MPKPNILVLVIDSFRSDKFFGEKKTSTTPNLDKIINDGVYFSQAISSAPASLPAVSSIMTGLYPFSSMTLQNKVYNLKEEIPTIGQKLSTKGYTNHAFIPKVFFVDDLTLYDGIGEKIIHRLNELESHEPWFFYLHLNDIHGQAIFHKNIIPEKFFDKDLGSNQYERMVSLMDEWLGKIFRTIDFTKTLIVITADHSSDVGIFDEELEELYKKTRESRIVKKSSVIKMGQKIFSKSPAAFKPLRAKLSNSYKKKRDSIIEKRGEPMLEEIETNEDNIYRKRVMRNIVRGTAQVFDDRFRIPLLFSGSGVDNNKIITKQVRSVDIYPTIFDIIELEVDEKIDGVSLLPLVHDSNVKDNPAIIESRINVSEGITSNTVGVRTSKYKYFRNSDNVNKDVGLFDLEKDPLEEKNIQKSNKSIVLEMENILKENLDRNN